jgi:hypothetical protein
MSFCSLFVWFLLTFFDWYWRMTSDKITCYLIYFYLILLILISPFVLGKKNHKMISVQKSIIKFCKVILYCTVVFNLNKGFTVLYCSVQSQWRFYCTVLYCSVQSQQMFYSTVLYCSVQSEQKFCCTVLKYSISTEVLLYYDVVFNLNKGFTVL